MLNLIGVGGAGISIVDHVSKQLLSKHDGFTDHNRIFIDLSRTNIDNIDHDKKEFYQIGSPIGEVVGSGGVRSTNVNIIREEIPELMKEYKLNKRIKNRVNVIISSASGGSGSVISPLLLNNMLSVGDVALIVLVGDTSTRRYAMSTDKTISSFIKIGEKKNKAIPIVYYDNNDIDPASIDRVATTRGVDSSSIDSEDVVDDYILSQLSDLGLVISNSVDDIDNEDIYNFLSPTNFNIGIEPGIVRCMSFVDKIVATESNIPLVALSVYPENMNKATDALLLQRKVGLMTEEVFKFYKSPINLVLMDGHSFTSIGQTIKDNLDKFKNLQQPKNKYRSVVASSTSDSDDDDIEL